MPTVRWYITESSTRLAVFHRMYSVQNDVHHKMILKIHHSGIQFISIIYDGTRNCYIIYRLSPQDCGLVYSAPPQSSPLSGLLSVFVLSTLQRWRAARVGQSGEVDGTIWMVADTAGLSRNTRTHRPRLCVNEPHQAAE